MLANPTIQQAVEFAVATEDMAAEAYAKLAEKFSDQKEISDVFSVLASDEKMHRGQFKALLSQLPAEEDAASREEDYAYLGAMAQSEFFADEGGLSGVLENVETVEEAMVRVLKFEKVTLGFYLAIQDVLGRQDALDAIIRAEKQHIIRLVKYVLTEEKMNPCAI